MCWRQIISRAEHFVGSVASDFYLNSIGNVETKSISALIRKITLKSNHPLINTFRAYIDESTFREIVPFYIRKSLPSKPPLAKLPECILIPIVGQICSSLDHDSAGTKISILEQQKQICNIFTTVNFAISLHRSVVEESPSLAGGIFSSPPDSSRKMDSKDDIITGNKLAILAGDILMAAASLSLASFQQPKIVAVMSAAIAKAAEAEFSEHMQTLDVTNHSSIVPPLEDAMMAQILSSWITHITLRHGSMLGASCECAYMLKSKEFSDSSLSNSARRFGSTWACISRLIDEYEFVKKYFSQLNAEGYKSTSEYIGFISAGLLEPTLADYLSIPISFEEPFFLIPKLYSKAAEKLSHDLRLASRELIMSNPYSPAEPLVSDSVSLLLSHEVFQNL